MLRVASASEYLVISGIGISDIKLVKEAIVLPEQSCTVFDVSPVNYTCHVHAMSTENISFVLLAVFTIGPCVDDGTSLLNYAKLISPFHNKSLSGCPVNEIVQGVVKYETCVLAASMTMDEILRGTKEFIQEVLEKVQLQLNQFGLLIYSSNFELLVNVHCLQQFPCLSAKTQVEGSNHTKVDIAEENFKGGKEQFWLAPWSGKPLKVAYDVNGFAETPFPQAKTDSKDQFSTDVEENYRVLFDREKGVLPFLQSGSSCTPRISCDALLPSVFQREIAADLDGYHFDEFQYFVTFGPIFREKDSPFFKHVKHDCLEHVLEMSQCSFPELVNRIASIEDEARAAYPSGVLDNLSRHEFLEMNALDGNFFLLLGYSTFGPGVELKFGKKHVIFGNESEDKDKTKWLESMFFLGNQVPFMVLEKLMGLGFFQELMEKNEWEQPLELETRTLYKFLMVRQERHPADLIHCLQSVVLGTESGSILSVTNSDDDMGGFPSASSLYESGIAFGILKGESGSREINYKPSSFFPTLNLPVLEVNKHTKLLFDSLKKYEIVREVQGFEREASSYFKLLAELIHTREDVEVLSSQGVLKGNPDSLLEFLASFHETVASKHLNHVRKQMRENPRVLLQKLTKMVSKLSKLGISHCCIKSLATT